MDANLLARSARPGLAWPGLVWSDTNALDEPRKPMLTAIKCLKGRSAFVASPLLMSRGMNRSLSFLTATALLAASPAFAGESSEPRFGATTTSGASAVWHRANGKFDGVIFTESVGGFYRTSDSGFVDVDVSANLNFFASLPSVWFGLHPGYRHRLVGPLFGAAGLDLMWNPEEFDVGAHLGLSLRLHSGPVELGLSVFGAAPLEYKVVELRGGGVLGYRF